MLMLQPFAPQADTQVSPQKHGKILECHTKLLGWKTELPHTLRTLGQSSPQY